MQQKSEVLNWNSDNTGWTTTLHDKVETYEIDAGITAITFPRSTSLVAITIMWQFSCQTIRQKSTTVHCRQPCVAMYDLDGDAERLWSNYNDERQSD